MIASIRTATLSTIGYQGASLAGLIATLRESGIGVLVDVRDVAYSRRPEFSSRALAAALEAAGLAYVHLRGLGNPKSSRDAAKAGDIAAYRRLFAEHMTSPLARADLDRLAELARNGGACIMCYERDPAECHRSLVAAALSERVALDVRHLAVAPPLKAPPAQGAFF